MAKQIEGVGDRLLQCAKKEFLAKGYKDASLRTIAENANTSTGSIYTRFKDKAGLFNEIVESTAIGFENKFREEIDTFDKMPQMSWEKMMEYTDNQLFKMIDMIYDDFDSFKLLVCRAEVTVFSEFIHNIVEFHVEYTIKYIESIGNDAIISKRLTPELLHMLCSSYWSGIFEIVAHEMSKEDAYEYIYRLKRFVRCGWNDIFSSNS